MSKPELSFSGQKLLEARKRAQMSRNDLARAINDMVCERSIFRYEAGITKPNVDVVMAIVRALKIKFRELLDAES